MCRAMLIWEADNARSRLAYSFASDPAANSFGSPEWAASLPWTVAGAPLCGSPVAVEGSMPQEGHLRFLQQAWDYFFIRTQRDRSIFRARQVTSELGKT